MKTKKYRKYPKNEVSVELKDGDIGVLKQTVPKMIYLAKRDVNEPIVVDTAKALKGNTDIETVQNVFEFVYKNFPYKSDPPNAEYVTAPVHLLSKDYKYCDCDDLTILLISLLLVLGFEMHVKVIAWNRKKCEGDVCPFTHVYLICYIPSLKGYIALDAVQKEAGFGQENPPSPIIRQHLTKV